MNGLTPIPNKKTSSTMPSQKNKGATAKENLIINEYETEQMSRINVINISNDQITYKQNGHPAFLYFNNNKLNLNKTASITFEIENQNIATDPKPAYQVLASIGTRWTQESGAGYTENVKGSVVGNGNNKYKVTINVDPNKLKFMNEYKKDANDFGIYHLEIGVVNDDSEILNPISFQGTITLKNIQIQQK